MAMAYKCDICGAYHSGNAEMLKICKEYAFKPDFLGDICPSCKESILTWIKLQHEMTTTTDEKSETDEPNF